MGLRYFIISIFIFSGCQQNSVFLNQFRDKGELALENIQELRGELTVNMLSMLKCGDNIVWNNYVTGKGMILYTFNLRCNSLNSFYIPLKDSVHTYLSRTAFCV